MTTVTKLVVTSANAKPAAVPLATQVAASGVSAVSMTDKISNQNGGISVGNKIVSNVSAKPIMGTTLTPIIDTAKIVKD